MRSDYITGIINSEVTGINLVSTMLSIRDYLGAVMVRWGINRNNYKIAPGLYATGNPDSSSDVFVTANYKLSFDHLRKNLEGINSWILILDTKGVNVWCAAGKKTFSTKELVKRINDVSLDKIVSHRRLVLPQLGATGVAAHKVREETGFNVKYGPVRAADIKEFINSGYKATIEMRKVTFRFWERLKLIPNDFIYGKYYLIGALAVMFLLSSILDNRISLQNSMNFGITRMQNILAGYFSGIVITPALLPYIPFKRFSLKGLVVGAFTTVILFYFNLTGDNPFEKVSWFLIIPVISSFMAMNFTGSSTYTSLSGVKKEMKLAVPLQIAGLSLGLLLFIIGLFI